MATPQNQKPRPGTRETEAVTFKAVEERQAAFGKTLQRTIRELDRVRRGAIDADAQAEQTIAEAERAAEAGDPVRRDELLKKIPGLRQQAQDLRGQVGDFVARLAQLREESTIIRQAAGAVFQAAEAELEAARQQRLRAFGLWNAAGSTRDVNRLREAVSKWKQELGIVDPPPQTKPKPVTADANKTPKCPHCKNDQFVRYRGREGIWRCFAAHHGPKGLPIHPRGGVLQIEKGGRQLASA